MPCGLSRGSNREQSALKGCVEIPPRPGPPFKMSTTVVIVPTSRLRVNIRQQLPLGGNISPTFLVSDPLENVREARKRQHHEPPVLGRAPIIHDKNVAHSRYCNSILPLGESWIAATILVRKRTKHGLEASRQKKGGEFLSFSAKYSSFQQLPGEYYISKTSLLLSDFILYLVSTLLYVFRQTRSIGWLAGRWTTAVFTHLNMSPTDRRCGQKRSTASFASGFFSCP